MGMTREEKRKKIRKETGKKRDEKRLNASACTSPREGKWHHRATATSDTRAVSGPSKWQMSSLTRT